MIKYHWTCHCLDSVTNSCWHPTLYTIYCKMLWGRAGFSEMCGDYWKWVFSHWQKEMIVDDTFEIHCARKFVEWITEDFFECVQGLWVHVCVKAATQCSAVFITYYSISLKYFEDYLAFFQWRHFVYIWPFDCKIVISNSDNTL